MRPKSMVAIALVVDAEIADEQAIGSGFDIVIVEAAAAAVIALLREFFRISKAHVTVSGIAGEIIMYAS